MRIVLFGRSGQVATEIARQAEAAGVKLDVIDRAVADLSDPASVAPALAERIAGAEAVINATAWTAVDAAEAEEETARAVNAVAPDEMARLCAKAGLPFLHVSTDYVFDGSGETARDEAAPTAPLSAYGRTKRDGEEAVRAAGGRHAILRTSWVFSAHGANFAKTMLRLGAERARLNVVADQIGGPTPAADIAAALLKMARAMAEGAPGGTFHFAGAPDTSWAGFAREIMARGGRGCEIGEIPTADWPTPAPRPLNSRLDCAAIHAAFGIARPDWRAGLDAVLTDLGETA
ncbi:dTDP-4-dehydrorhamnose reductase [Limimaricola hongkongensis]|uniref:dTDP-4-dehydrorhamnose reductase n=1 Tax=Limimaricola hongkongensis DSM 17492 TaxID=1122180 RepID=A0A017H8C2_9RHOB|nr:dTDP-4-dehydrorhamnose reductase [Limimaricola hongkongensis]EYD70530.1 dTDP-4-dehydrorhamnose reductase [Limimaricola hongkongensis DSM 17492]